MALIFNYAVLQATPDARRGERVNVGIVIFLKERLDIRLSDLAKVKALTGDDWTSYVKNAEGRLNDCFSADDDPESTIRRFSVIERGLSISNVSWFSTDDASQYDERVAEILKALVNRPQKERKPSTSRLNTEIAKEFRAKRVLARPDEDILDHRIVRQFEVSREEGLVADFGLKNGVYHIATTLDLRRPKVNIEEAAFKAIVLDKAGEIFGKDAKRIGVYAADSTETVKSPHVNLLADYADEIYNWANEKQREAFTRRMYDAINSPGNFQLQ